MCIYISVYIYPFTQFSQVQPDVLFYVLCLTCIPMLFLRILHMIFHIAASRSHGVAPVR